MENKLFLMALIIFGAIDIYKIIKKELNFFSLYRPLFLIILYKYILDGLSSKFYLIILFYFLITTVIRT